MVKSTQTSRFGGKTLFALAFCGLLATFLFATTPAVAISSSGEIYATSTTAGPTTTVPTSTTTTTMVLPTKNTVPVLHIKSKLRWPLMGSAAVAIPQLSVVASSPSQPREPIASLTKMMTAWVVLHRFPLTFSQSGPCLTVNARDVALYNYDVATDQSSVKIVEGMRVCEGVLLRGLFVHSAGDYAQLLVALTGMNQSKFVAKMNRDAKALGLSHTHYVDFTGIAPRDLSTAKDQATLAVDLMTNEPVVQSIAALSQVALPVVGVVSSYTPFIGHDGVIGVKSGFTNPAGGCDVMAMKVLIHHTAITTYAVVLGQHGSDPLGMAGQAALNLSHSLRASISRVATPTGTEVQWVGSPSDLSFPTPASKS
jgi:D-alanyl-D-alanine carboxypeptidase (penicillin-binding protein 5/6)